MNKLIGNPVGCDENMNRVQLAALAGETQVSPVLEALSNQTKALEDYLKERRIIQNSYSMKDFGIVDPYPKQPTPAKSLKFRKSSSRVDTLTIPADQVSVSTQESPVAKHISDVDMQLAKYLMYLQRLNAFAQEISDHYKICLDLDELFLAGKIKDCAKKFDTDYRIVHKAYYNLDYHFRHTQLLTIMDTMLKLVEFQAECVKDDQTSTTANLVRGLAMCMIVSIQCIKDHYKDLTGCISDWLLYGAILIRQWGDRDPKRTKAPPSEGGVVTYAQDQEELEKEWQQPEVTSPQHGMDVMC